MNDRELVELLNKLIASPAHVVEYEGVRLARPITRVDKIKGEISSSDLRTYFSGKFFLTGFVETNGFDKRVIVRRVSEPIDWRNETV